MQDINLFDYDFTPTLELRTLSSSVDVQHIRMTSGKYYHEETFVPDPVKLAHYIQI